LSRIDEAFENSQGRAMRLARRQFLTSTLAAAAAPALVRSALLRPAVADAPITLKLHHFLSSVSSAHNKFLAPWARKVETESGGRIRIDIFPSMQLGGAPAQLYEQARDGIADIAWVQPSNTPGRFPKIEVFELPFVSSRRAFVNSKALQAYAAANLGDEFREVHPICFWCQDHGLLHANRQVASLDHLKDLKLRFPTQFAGEALRALGASGVGMPLLQLPLALAQHVVDGCLSPWEAMPALRLDEALKFHTEMDGSPALATTTHVLAMNKRSYDRLPADLQKVINDNSGETTAVMAGAMYDDAAAAVANLARQRGDTVTTLAPEEAARWHKATEPVITAWLKHMKEHRRDGGKLLEDARARLAQYEQEPEPVRQEPPAPKPEEKPAPNPVEPPAVQAEQTPVAAPTEPLPKPPVEPAPVAKPAAPPAAKPPQKPAALDIPI
jgi:TRAP-type C4-dicarboxylate transport system substrate-binding protein